MPQRRAVPGDARSNRCWRRDADRVSGLSSARTLLIDRVPSERYLLEVLIADAGIAVALEVYPSVASAFPALAHPPPGIVLVGDTDDLQPRVEVIRRLRRQCPQARIALLISFIAREERLLLEQAFPDIPCWVKAMDGVAGYDPALRFLAEPVPVSTGRR